MIHLDEYTNFLIDNKLSEQQLLLLMYIKDQRRDLIAKYKKAFPIIGGSMISDEAVKDLVDKGFLVSLGKGYTISEKFLDLYVTSEVAVDEIYALYPAFVLSDQGTNLPLTAMDKNEFKDMYIPKIMGSVKEHNEVIKDIQYGVDENLIKIGINKFLTSEGWKPLRELRRKETRTPNATLDNDF